MVEAYRCLLLLKLREGMGFNTESGRWSETLLPPFHAAQPVGPAFGVEGVVVLGAAGVPPAGPEEGGEADHKQIERPQEAGLEAVPVLVLDHLVVGRRPEIDEVPQGDAAPHVPRANDMDGRWDPGIVLKTPFPFQKPANNEPQQVLRQLPDLQEDGTQEIDRGLHITRTR